jgi:AraC family transcriptional regulator
MQVGMIVADNTNPDNSTRDGLVDLAGLTTGQHIAVLLPDARCFTGFNTLTSGFLAEAAGRADTDRAVVLLSGDDCGGQACRGRCRKGVMQASTAACHLDGGRTHERFLLSAQGNSPVRDQDHDIQPPAAGPATPMKSGGAVVRHWPGMRSEYAWLAPHEDATITKAHQVGVAFSGHDRLMYSVGGRGITADIPPGSTIVSGDAPITWLQVREPTEALEIYPDLAVVAAVEAAASRPIRFDQSIGGSDAVVLGIGSILRRAHICGTEISDVAASTLADRLVTHLATRYSSAGLPARIWGQGRLDPRRFDQVVDLVEARLGGKLTLQAMADQAGLSPFHFARTFKESTGLPPHAFVTARRMDRARILLRTSGRPVEEVARAVGFDNISHFRRVFRRHHGVNPAVLRGMRPPSRWSANDSKNGPCAEPSSRAH